MIENTYAEPGGYTMRPAPVRYRIRSITPSYTGRYALAEAPLPRLSDYTFGAIEEHETEVSYDGLRSAYYHALALSDQLYADLITALVQQACGYFIDPTVGRKYEPLDGVPEVVVSDEAVLGRIQRLDHGENTREAERSTRGLGRNIGHYPLTLLPFAQQRALVEQIEALKARFAFEIIGPAA